MKVFKFEKDHFKKMFKEFSFKYFSRLIFITISIEFQLIDWCHLF